MKEVTIVQRILPHYRVEFFEGLRKKLEEKNIKLLLVYGTSNAHESLKKDETDLNWGIKIKNRHLRFGSVEVCWQPCMGYLKNSEIVIVEQANKNLINYWLLFRKIFTKKKVAFWGHGRNLQDDKKSIANKFKSIYINGCDWWFAYTSKVKEFLIENSFPEKKITVVQNAINTDEILMLSENISQEEIDLTKQKLKITSQNIGIYCGGIYSEKRIPFLVEASEKIKKEIPDFHLIILGSGADVDLLKNLIKGKDWIHYLGPKFGREKIILFKTADVFLMPGLVGLAILDAFATQTPLITTKFPFHSPEIEYLETNKNGMVSEDNMECYVKTVIGVLKDKQLLTTLKQGCQKSSKKYTLEAMINNYADGVCKCLNS